MIFRVSYKKKNGCSFYFIHKWSNSMLTFTLNTITFVSVFASATVRSHSINAFSIFMAWMQIGRTFVDFSTIEFINAPKSGKAIACIWTNCVFTHRIQVAMITILTTLLCALINICKWTIIILSSFVTSQRFRYANYTTMRKVHKQTCAIEAISLEAKTTGTRIFCIEIKTRSVYVTGMTLSTVVISFSC